MEALYHTWGQSAKRLRTVWPDRGQPRPSCRAGDRELAEAGYRLHAVLGLGELLDTLVEAGHIGAGQRDEVAAFLWGG
jgi:hypothetical protein